MDSNHSKTDSLFVLRRAFLVGVCRRADINRACGTTSSPNRASAIMRSALRQWPELLYNAPHRGIFPRDGAPHPAETKASLIFSLMAHGAGPRETGIFNDDGIPVLMPEPKPARALRDEATQIVIEAAIRNQPVRILYVGLRRGDTPRWRRIWPRAMEFTGLHWRIHAQVMDVDSTRQEQSFPMRTFVLSRIMDAQSMSTGDVPVEFKPRTIVRRDRVLRVSLSEDLTPEQARVIRNTFDIQGGLMTWPDHSLYEFRREFAGESPQKDVVWPTITRLDILE